MSLHDDIASRATKWLSNGLETLVMELEEPDLKRDSHDFDVVIVGSGYGASIAAAELSACADKAGNKLRICVLERGKEYLAGMFPSRQSNLGGHVRFVTPEATRQRGVHDGLYDIRWSSDAVAVVASGLGGGSLINAGVMEMPLASVFKEARWPRAIRADAEGKNLFRLATQIRRWLGARKISVPTEKTKALQQVAGTQRFRRPPVTVATKAGPNAANVTLDACLRCGDCATGCNYNAKDSLDLNLLRLAKGDEHNRNVRIYTGAVVLRVVPMAKGGSGWLVLVNHTDKQLRDRQHKPFPVRAKRVILAAGTFGSTEILLRSQNRHLRFSAQLGRKFSANGDMIATAHDLERAGGARVNAIADETTDPSICRDIGPTITGMIDRRTGMAKTDVVIQDLAVPGPLRRLFEESITTADVLSRLVEGDCRTHTGNPATPDDATVDPAAFKKSLVVAMIGRDDADGELTAGSLTSGSKSIARNADGLLTVKWPSLGFDTRFDLHHDNFEELLKAPGLSARLIANLVWRPFSKKIESVFGRQRGPLVTVHPLGGCAMGESILQGVTDDCGRVFRAPSELDLHPGPTDVHEGLIVLDGSIIPTSLGINPALTISVLALRAIEILTKDWGLIGGRLSQRPAIYGPARRRPPFAKPEIIATPRPTKIELTEQMRGRMWLWMGLLPRRHRVEITLTTEPTELAQLTEHVTPHGRCLSLARGRLRILKANTNFDTISDDARPSDVALTANLSGTIRVFRLKPSTGLCRTISALLAWWFNRGWRDLWQSGVQAVVRWIRREPPLEPPLDSLPTSKLRVFTDYLNNIWRLCSRAGAVRLVEYDLTVGKILHRSGDVKWDDSQFSGAVIKGVKSLTYRLFASPYKQLMALSIKAFPRKGWRPPGCAPVLGLNPRYLAKQAVPLMRFVGQQDRVAALVDLLSFGLYAFRVILQTHALSFRKPDPPAARIPRRLPGAVGDFAARIPRRLPGAIRDLLVPQIDWLEIGTPSVRIRVARYDGWITKAAKSTGPRRPVLLIHGYSASGTTYAHPAVPGNLVETLFAACRDVWVLDMRSSAGLPTARRPWRFEDMAQNDIPVTINHILSITGADKVDVVAHCMGAAMFSMAVLNPLDTKGEIASRIGRVVLSQIGPVMVLSKANIFRAYVMRYVREFLMLDDYAFSPEGKNSLASQLFDRALAALPIPLREFRRENPLWPPGMYTPWVGTRHRMDALYARTFSLSNLSDKVLDAIDDFFGPLSIETVSQVIHFAGFNTVTDKDGINRYVSPPNLRERFTFPILSIHGEQNGLSDVATLRLMRNTLRDADIEYLNDWPVGKPDPTMKAQSHTAMKDLIGKKASRLAENSGSYMTWRIARHGHQDCLIGKKAGKICSVIAAYLNA